VVWCGVVKCAAGLRSLMCCTTCLQWEWDLCLMRIWIKPDWTGCRQRERGGKTWREAYGRSIFCWRSHTLTFPWAAVLSHISTALKTSPKVLQITWLFGWKACHENVPRTYWTTFRGDTRKRDQSEDTPNGPLNSCCCTQSISRCNNTVEGAIQYGHFCPLLFRSIRFTSIHFIILIHLWTFLHIIFCFKLVFCCPT